jgi:hypothetical protein
MAPDSSSLSSAHRGRSGTRAPIDRHRHGRGGESSVGGDADSGKQGSRDRLGHVVCCGDGCACGCGGCWYAVGRARGAREWVQGGGRVRRRQGAAAAGGGGEGRQSPSVVVGGGDSVRPAKALWLTGPENPRPADDHPAVAAVSGRACIVYVILECPIHSVL